MTFKATVVGGGVIGLSTALTLTEEFPHCYVTVVAKAFHPDGDGLTSFHGFGILSLARSANPTVSGKAFTWWRTTWDRYVRMHPSVAERAGIRPRDLISLFKIKDEADLNEQLPITERLVHDMRPATQRQMKKFDHLTHGGAQDELFPSAKPGSKLVGFVNSTAVVDSALYLPWLRNQLEGVVTSNGKKRVTFIAREVNSLEELTDDDCDVIINCSGMGARKLANDSNVIPFRGQYIKIGTSLQEDCVVTAGETVVCPRTTNVALGGVYQEGRDSTQVDPEDTASILRRCEVMIPAVKGKKILEVGVGIRPGRLGGARLELDWLRTHPKAGSRIRTGANRFPVVHNYGHGGWGFGVHWGCAMEVCSLVREALPAFSKL